MAMADEFRPGDRIRVQRQGRPLAEAEVIAVVREGLPVEGLQLRITINGTITIINAEDAERIDDLG